MKISYLPDKYSQQRQRQKAVWVYPVLMAMQAQYAKQNGHQVFWDWCPENADKIITEPQHIDFLKLPYPDRLWTNAFAKKYQQYGNYKYHPATHMQVADGCWHGKCAFCVERLKDYKVRPVEHVLEELDDCRELGFREIFDDSGTFPDGEWLERFCIKVMAKEYGFKFGCNMRIDGVCDFKLMKQAGFRMLLYGLESTDQYTLNRIGKGVDKDEYIKVIRAAAEYGLEPHIAVMFGYPWSTEESELKTLELVHYLLRKGYAKTAQASLYSVQGMASIDRGYVKRIYNAAYHLDFWLNKLSSIHSYEDVKYLFKQIKKGITRD